MTTKNKVADCDVHYNVGWIDAIDAAVKIVNEARSDGTSDLREVRARIQDLKRHASEDAVESLKPLNISIASAVKGTNNSMLGKTVEEHNIGPLSFSIKKLGARRYALWLNGCRIGKPTPDGQIWKFTPTTLTEARCELSNAAKRELTGRIRKRESEIRELKEKLGGHAMAKLDSLILASQKKKAA